VCQSDIVLLLAGLFGKFFLLRDFLLLVRRVVEGHIAALAATFGVVARVFMLTVPGSFLLPEPFVATLAHLLGVVSSVLVRASEVLGGPFSILLVQVPVQPLVDLILRFSEVVF